MQFHSLIVCQCVIWYFEHPHACLQKFPLSMSLSYGFDSEGHFLTEWQHIPYAIYSKLFCYLWHFPPPLLAIYIVIQIYQMDASYLKDR